MEVKQLKKRFDGKGEVKGYVFTQMRVSAWAFLYEVESGGHKHYEVFKRAIRPYGGKVLENKNNDFTHYIAYPTSRCFGKWAWTCMTKEKAEKRFNNLKQEKHGQR